MRKYLILVLVLVLSNLGFAQITFFACPDSFTSSPNAYTFVEEGTDSTGRNFYQTNPIEGDQPCAAGACEFRIAWNDNLGRWEILLVQNEADFSDAIVVYYNSSASTPYPPSLNLGAWIDVTGSCGGALNSANSTLTGNVQNGLTLSVDELKSINTQISIFPNPVSHTLYVRSVLEPIKTIFVYSLQGKEIMSAFNASKLDVSKLSKGVYFVEVTTRSNKTLQRKVIVN